jgi:hypothetical protein
VSKPSHRDQNVAALGRRGVADAGFVLAADHGHHADAASLGVSVLGEGNRVDALLSSAPAQ